MGIVSTVLGFSGFGFGFSAGIVIGYYLFIYFQPTDVKDVKVRPLVEYDSNSLDGILPEIPLWVKNPDYDRIDWLNRFLEMMWPYLNKAICRTAQEIAKPIIAENTAKYKIDSVEFESLTLGSLPPTFQGMKVYVTEEQELIMEPSLKWAANPNVSVTVKAYGLKATIQIVDLQVFALPRITLKPLVPTFPCFAKILVSLMEKPHVDFGLKLLGADVMAIPGLYRFVQETIKKQVASMYLWPKTLEVPIMDPSKASKKPVGILLVKVLRAQNLRKKDMLGKSDPYVKLKMSDDKLPSKKTAVKRSNLNPEWNQDFKFVVTDPETQALEINVFDWEQVGKHEKMGMNSVLLKELPPEETKVTTLNLLKTMDPNDIQNEKSRGQITLELTYKPFKEEDVEKEGIDGTDEVQRAPDGTPADGGLLYVVVHEAQDLEGKHHTNPYVKIIFKGEEKKTNRGSKPCPMPTPTPTMTPKALIHQKYGAKACYRVEEVREAVDGGCPGLALPQQTRSVYRCSLDLPGLTVVTPGTFVRKKDAEQSAAQIALDKLGIQPTANTPSTPEEAWDELISRISGFFADENFLSSSHPLVGHLSVTLRRTGDLFGMIPVSAIAACDVKVNTLCKTIEPKAEFDPLLVLSLVYNAAKQSPGVSISNSNFWIQSQRPYSPEAVDLALKHWSGISDPIEVEAILVPFVLEDEPKTVTLNLSHNEHYMGDIASKLSASDSSHVVVSRTVGKASSEIRFYFPAPNVQFVFDLSKNVLACRGDGNLNCQVNKRASYISGQTIYGDAILANVGYTRRDSELRTEDVNLCTYYRILLGKLPDGNYKMSRESILAAELPSVYSRSSWKGLSPRDLLCSFCRFQRLSEPHFAVSSVNASCSVLGSAVSCEETGVPKKTAENQHPNDVNINNGNLDCFKSEVKIYSKKQELLLEYSAADTWSKESDAIQNSSLKVLIWFNNYFEQLKTHTEKLSLSETTDGFKIHQNNFSQEFAMCLSVYGKTGGNDSRMCSAVGPFSMDTSKQQLENSAILIHMEGPDSGVFPSNGSLTCISYTAHLVMKDNAKRYLLESNNEFEFEIGTGAVRNQLESCVTQLSVNQTASFVSELPPRDLILAAASESSHELSKISRDSCFLEFSVKVLQVTEPLEDRMEKALFNPPLSKQRVEFSVGHINELNATTLVDFGCGSGSLLDSLLEHSTTLEKVVGVDISRKGLTRAAKSLHQKLSKKSSMQTSVPTAVLYDGSITDFDSRLYGFDIGTCLEVIEHMEEDEASLFGNVVLSSFHPAVLIVSTPNYEYNPILQRSAVPNKEDEPEENAGPCKFRNHDHKFEWTRAQFHCWATGLAVNHNYSVEFSGVGGSGEEPGYASQIAVFRRMVRNQEETFPNKDDLHQPYELLWEWPNASIPSH